MKISKVLSVIAIVLMLVVSFSNCVYATGKTTTTSTTTSTKNPLDPSKIDTTPPSGTDGIKTLGGQIVGIIQTIGSVLAVAVLVVLGVKYMMGSAEEKAEYKKTLLPYVIGAVLVFAAVNISGIVFNAVSGIGK